MRVRARRYRRKIEKRELEVTVERGMKTGQRLTFPGMGDTKPNCLPGDVVLVVEQKPHETFQRRGADLIMKKEITLLESLTGVKLVIDHLDGHKVLITSKSGDVVAPDSVKEVPDEGMPVYGHPHVKGVLFIQFEVRGRRGAAHFPRRASRIVVASTLHPEYRQVLETYLVPLGCEIVVVPATAETLDAAVVAQALDEQTACLVVQHPNFFGCLEDVRTLAAACHEQGVQVVQVFDPISLGLLSRPGDLGADIAVAEGQCLGNPLLFGGPYLGILAARESFMRRMPGRIAGQTIGAGDKRCWVLTLQTREQHIRRDKATSNVCTNQGLFALRASIYLALLGPQGLREVAESCVRKARYAAHRLVEAGWQRRSAAPCFKEFVVRDPEGNVAERIEAGIEQGMLIGVPLGEYYPDLGDSLLVAVTEKRTRQEIDRLAEILATNGAGV